jgi:hypothetical protein
MTSLRAWSVTSSRSPVMIRSRALARRHVAAGDCPFVVLFGEHGADQADHRVAVGEDPDDVGAAAQLLVEPFLGVVRPDLAPVLLGEPGEREHVGGGFREVVAASPNRSVS